MDAAEFFAILHCMEGRKLLTEDATGERTRNYISKSIGIAANNALVTAILSLIKTMSPGRGNVPIFAKSKAFIELVLVLRNIFPQDATVLAVAKKTDGAA
jgi:hypothetical protein